MNISIFRRRFTNWGWDGSLFINGIFFCGTLENCRSRLAQGTYKIALLPVYNQGKGSYSIMPVILKETSRIPKSVIRKPVIMPGNGPYTLNMAVSSSVSLRLQVLWLIPNNATWFSVRR